jgi:CRISPR-associated protein Cas5a/b/c
MPLGRRYDRVLVLSRSGTTTEIVQLLARLRGVVPTVAITAATWAPVAQAADDVIDLGFADEESVVQTRFATTELALLRAHLGHDPGPAADAAERVLAAPLPPGMLTARQFTFLGTGWTCGLANEAALKLREAAGMWTEAYPAMEYRHGPVAVTGKGSVVWLFGPPPDGLGEEIAAAGGTAWLGDEDPMAELVRVQMLAVAVARARGLDPDRPAYHGGLEPIARACLAVAGSAAVPVAVHLDHASSADLVQAAARFGLGSVMFDASRLPYTENVRATAEVARWCRDRGVWTEAELGEIGGKNGVHSPLARTDPDEAAGYVAATRVDALAVAVGSSHAMLTRDAVLDTGLGSLRAVG